MQQQELTNKQVLSNILSSIEQRVTYFSARHLSAENVLTSTGVHSIRSLSEIIPQLCSYTINQTPLSATLADIYLGREIKTYQEIDTIKYILPPVSDGEDSINQEDAFQPTFKWIASTLVDSSLLVLDQIEAKKVQRGKIPPEWKNVIELVICNIQRKIYNKSQIQKIQDHFKNRFSKFPWIQIKKVKEMFYKGKPSVILKFSQETSASFVYFNLMANTTFNKQYFGQNMEIFRIIQNKIKERQQNDITLIFRKLPTIMTRQTLYSLFPKKCNILWMEELVQICGYKYTICKCPYLEDAFSIITNFMSKNIKDAKVNYHMRSGKKWRQDEQILEGVNS